MTRKPILPPTYFWVAAVLSFLLHFAFRKMIVVPYPWSIIGFVPIVFGAVFNIWADQLFKKRNTTVKPFEHPSVLVTDGPFAWSRHPMYLGMTAILLGIAVICGTLPSFLGPILFWLVIRSKFVRAEEQSMSDAFGEEYAEYQKRVQTWI